MIGAFPNERVLARPKLDSRGRFSVVVQQRSSKSWQAVYGGNSTSSAAVSKLVKVP